VFRDFPKTRECIIQSRKKASDCQMIGGVTSVITGLDVSFVWLLRWYWEIIGRIVSFFRKTVLF